MDAHDVGVPAEDALEPAAVTGPIAEVLTGTTGLKEGAPATLTASDAGPSYSVPPGSTWSLEIVVSNGAPKLVTVTDASTGTHDTKPAHWVDASIHAEELTATENKVSFARQAYNDQVTEYNTYKQTFPPVLLAATFGHSANASLLEFEDHAAIQEAPKVKF